MAGESTIQHQLHFRIASLRVVDLYCYSRALQHHPAERVGYSFKAWVAGSNPAALTIFFMSVPETWVTERSGDMVDCTPKLRQQEALHFAAKGLQSAEEEKERAVCAGVPAVCQTGAAQSHSASDRNLVLCGACLGGSTAADCR